MEVNYKHVHFLRILPPPSIWNHHNKVKVTFHFALGLRKFLKVHPIFLRKSYQQNLGGAVVQAIKKILHTGST